MKKQTMAVATAMSLLFVASNVEALYIDDSYWGAGQPNVINDGSLLDTSNETNAKGKSGDVYDPLNQGYNISGMDVTISNHGILIVKIYSKVDDYFNNWHIYIDSSSGISSLAKPGSLFLSTNGWKPDTSATSYGADGDGTLYNGTDGEDWEYVIMLDNFLKGDLKYNSTSLYATTQGATKVGTERAVQEAWFLPNANESSKATVPNGAWLELDSNTNKYFLTITTDLSKIDGWSSVQEWGLHWTMACANDVIEGSFSPVPEPATALLFGAGLAGLAAFGRRRGRN